MSMTADIETETTSGVLAVPIQSVTVRQPKKEGQGGGEGGGESGPPATTVKSSVRAKEASRPKEIVFAVEGGVVKAFPVKRGISNDAVVEITEGVTEGMEIVSGSYKAINRELEDGMKVKVEEAKKPGERKPEKEG
jgi:HlyD family secretion protein